jgi:hypothetical protein
MAAYDEPLSPELVLVAPPDLAAAARRLLPETPFVVLPVPGASELSTPYGLGFVAFVAVCLAATLGPVALAISIR